MNMTFERRLEALREKPEHVRRRIAFWTSFGITAVIALFWVASFTATITGEQNPVTKAVAEVSTPAQSLAAAAGNVITDLRDLIFGPKKIVYSTVQVSPGK